VGGTEVVRLEDVRRIVRFDVGEPVAVGPGVGDVIAGGDRRFLRQVAVGVIRVVVSAVGSELVVVAAAESGPRAISRAAERVAFVRLRLAKTRACYREGIFRSSFSTSSS